MNEYDTGLDYAPRMKIDIRQSSRGNPSYWVETTILGKEICKHLHAKSIEEAVKKGIVEIQWQFNLLSSGDSADDMTTEDFTAAVDKEIARSFMRAKTQPEVSILHDTMVRLKKVGIDIPESLAAYARAKSYLDEKSDFERKT